MRDVWSIRWAVVLVCLLSVGAPSGCGNRRPQTAPVTGKVTLDGKQVTGGVIFFYPEEGRPATGIIGSDGTYVLQTFEAGDGAIPGKYRVTIQDHRTGGPPSTDPNALSQPVAKPIFPPKYANRQTSPLEEEVAAGPNTLNFDLKRGS